jgi:ubiquinone/menaquinone biosynthesis C-methylase UbiE
VSFSEVLKILVTLVPAVRLTIYFTFTFSVAAWDHLGTEPIVNKMMASVIKGRDAKVKDSLPLTPSLTTPHIVEKMIEDSGLSCIKIDRGEYPLYLSRDRSPNSAFDLVSLPIKNKLGSLMMSGERPRAFEDARAAFDKMIAAKEIRKDANGRFVIDDNRFKILVARREYEDEDALKKIEKEKAATESKKNLVPATAPIPLDTIAKFDELLETSFRHRYLPMSHFHKAIRHVVDVEGNADTKKISVMDLGSRPAKITPASFLADAFPEASIHSVDVSSAATTPEEGVKSDTRALEIEIVKLGTKLSSVPDKSIDIITCAFGLQYIEDLDSIMNQVHRVLKPGGSFIATSWDSISLEHISNRILAEVVGTTSVSVLAPFMDIAKFAEPHFLEKLVEHGGLNVMKSEHYEFPFVLEADGIVDDNTFNTAVLPIRHILNNLEESGSRPHALSDARGAFDRMIEKGEFLSIDDHGCLITDANRFNIVVARRLFEDSDGIWTME